jgi:hypothetical protein
MAFDELRRHLLPLQRSHIYDGEIPMDYMMKEISKDYTMKEISMNYMIEENIYGLYD